MNSTVKILAIIAFVALLLAGCGKTEIINDDSAVMSLPAAVSETFVTEEVTVAVAEETETTVTATESAPDYVPFTQKQVTVAKTTEKPKTTVRTPAVSTTVAPAITAPATTAPKTTAPATTAVLTTKAPETTSVKATNFDFRTTDINGNSVSFSDYNKARVIMFNMWEPWCGPCVGEMPELEKLYENYKDKGLVIVGITSSSETEVKYVLSEKGITYPVIFSSSDFNRFSTGYVPTTVFMDSQGNVLNSEDLVGAKSYSAWEKLVLKYLG